MKLESVTPVHSQDIVSTNVARLSPQKRGNICRAKHRGLKLQALNKDEDSAGLEKEARNLPQSRGCGTSQLTELSRPLPFWNIP